MAATTIQNYKTSCVPQINPTVFGPETFIKDITHKLQGATGSRNLFV